MKLTVAPQTCAFFTKNGFIELAMAHPSLFDQAPLSKRDLWRENGALQTFLLKTLPPIIFSLIGKKPIRLGMDQWFSEEDIPQKACTIKEMFPMQGFVLGLILAPKPEYKPCSVGIVPMPTEMGNVLFFNPNLLLNWQCTKGKRYIALYTVPNAVCVNDPFLKQFGYENGDVLVRHPLIHP